MKDMAKGPASRTMSSSAIRGSAAPGDPALGHRGEEFKAKVALKTGSRSPHHRAMHTPDPSRSSPPSDRTQSELPRRSAGVLVAVEQDAWPFRGPVRPSIPMPRRRVPRQAPPYYKRWDEHVSSSTRSSADVIIYVVPVGQAVNSLRKRIIAGEMPGIAKQSELFTDKLGHAKPLLETLVAYVHFAGVQAIAGRICRAGRAGEVEEREVGREDEPRTAGDRLGRGDAASAERGDEGRDEVIATSFPRA